MELSMLTSFLKNDNILDKWKISELHTIIGELYYDNESIDLALERFYMNERLTFDSAGVPHKALGSDRNHPNKT
jgi:hypothetical protein